jgi:hypothetical protein
MKAHEFIRETFDLDSRTSISELPDLPISLIVEMLNNYKEGKVKKLLIPLDNLKEIYKLQEKISDIYYATNLSPAEKQEQIKWLEREIDEIKDRTE